MRASNRRVVLELIERHGPVSRADLARLAGLSMPSTSEIVADLLASGLVVWGGEGASRGGRRPMLLRFHPARASVLAVDLGGMAATMGLFLLDGTSLVEDRFSLPESARGAEAVHHLVAAVRAMVERAPRERPELLGVGIAAPGVTDPETGEVSLAPVVGWTGTPVRHLLEQQLGLHVVVDNDVNAAALAEWRFGDGARYGSFAFVSIGTGVGMGIILDGQIHRGRLNQAGEIGYMVLDPDWADTPDGFGNLESRVALPALARDYARLAASGGPASPSPPVDAGVEAAVRRLLDDAAAGRQDAAALLRERARLLARALVNTYAVLAPEAIFLGGPISPYLAALLPIVEVEAARLVPFRPVLLRSALGQRAGLMGACALASDMVKEQLLAQAPAWKAREKGKRWAAGALDARRLG